MDSRSFKGLTQEECNGDVQVFNTTRTALTDTAIIETRDCRSPLPGKQRKTRPKPAGNNPRRLLLIQTSKNLEFTYAHIGVRPVDKLPHNLCAPLVEALYFLNGFGIAPMMRCGVDMSSLMPGSTTRLFDDGISVARRSMFRTRDRREWPTPDAPPLNRSVGSPSLLGG